MKKLFTYTLCIFLTLPASGQKGNRLDSLIRLYKPAKKDTAQINVINQIANEYRNNDPDTSLYFAGKALDYSTAMDYKDGMAAAHIAIGTALTNKGEHKKALEHLSEGLKLARSAGNKPLTARAYANTGNIYLREAKFDRAMSSYMSALAIRKQTGDKIGMAGLYNNIGMVHGNMSDYPSALESYDEAIRLYSEANDQEGMALSYNNSAVVYNYMGRTTDAISNYFNALRISEKIGDKINIARPYGNLGLIYMQQAQYDEALKYFDKALQIFTEINDQSGISQTYNARGTVYHKLKRYQEAKEDFQKALSIREKTNDRLGTSMTYNNIASVELEQKNFAAAMRSYQEALRIKEEIGDPGGIANTFVNIGGLYIAQEKYSEAIPFLKKSLGIAEEIGHTECIRDASRFLSRAHEALGDHRTAFEHYQRYIVYRDSLINKENTKKITQQQMQFDFDKKESIAKAEQRKKDELTQQQAQKERMIRNFFIAGFVLVLLLAIFIYKGYSDKKKANLIIEAKKLEVERQKELVEEKQKEILDSISYAKRLQEAILPPSSLISKHLPDSFVLYRPKDIVAGDFYWMETVSGSRTQDIRQKNPDTYDLIPDTILIAAADCTGHGVPGAMVSVVCSNALNRTVKEFGITEPGKILDRVRELVIETFEKSESQVRDGMDISLISLNKNTMQLRWAGANNPLWIIREGKLLDFHPDKQPIGRMDAALPFTTQIIPIRKGDCLYLFSDGFADQFGGPKGKKFKYKQLQEVLLSNAETPMSGQSSELERRLREWQGKLEQIDDILVIGIRIG